MRRTATISTSALNVWALDFTHNLALIQESIETAKSQGATFRSGPELEITGYDCTDHFFESDTVYHSWEVVVNLLTNDENTDIIIDVGMPVDHDGVLYNCRVILLNRKILMIRPKTILCDNGTYCETRWFTAWTKLKECEDHYLPQIIRDATDQRTTLFGDVVLQTNDTCIGFEICEELWNPNSRHIEMGLDGVEIFVNSSGDGFSNRNSMEAVDFAKTATLKGGGCYIYTNLKGCGGDRYYYKGNSMVVFNGELIDCQKVYTLTEVNVLTTSIDLDDVRTFRYSTRSRCLMSAAATRFPKAIVDFNICTPNALPPTVMPLNVPDLPIEQEILEGCACWLWDYLRKSRTSGLLLPLTDDVSSVATALIVYMMCQKISIALRENDTKVGYDYAVMFRDTVAKDSFNDDPRSICHTLLHTLHIKGQEPSDEVENFAEKLSSIIGSDHHSIDVSSSVSSLISSVSSITDTDDTDRHALYSHTADRIANVTAYTFSRSFSKNKLLVLGKGCVDHFLVGDVTKHGSAYGDISVVNGVNLNNLQGVIRYAASRFEMPECLSLLSKEETLTRSKRLLNYNEISICGKLRKSHFCGPYAMFLKLMNLWSDKADKYQVLEKVKYFFMLYSHNRHKVTGLSPALNFEVYNCEDSRMDFRPIIYSHGFNWQFNAITEYCRRN